MTMEGTRIEKTIYEIKYNDWFSIRMESEREPMEEIEFDKAALEAVLTDIVLRETARPGTPDETRKLWEWIVAQVGLALQNTSLPPESEHGQLAVLQGVVSGWMENRMPETPR